MNMVDYGILLLLGISITTGVYNGFVVSALHAASFFISWLGALIFYPMISSMLVNKFPKLFESLVYYVDGSSNIPSIEDRTARISTFSSDQLMSLLDRIQLPNPFARIITADVGNVGYEAQTLGQYFDNTIAGTIVNIFSFLLLFFLLKLLFTVIISVSKSVTSLPVLKQFDSLFGAGFGFFRGIFILYFVYAIIPILLALAPVDVFTQYLDASKFSDLFYRTNIFTNFVRGHF